MPEKEQIADIVAQCYAEILQDAGLDAPQAENPCLLGPDSTLDSLSLVNLIVTIEQKLYDRFGITVSLVSEDAMSSENSPFRTSSSLISHIDALMRQTIDG